MRAITTAQTTDLAALERYENTRVYVANATGTLTDLSTYFLDAEISCTVDQMAMTAEVTMLREVVGTSLAPLMGSNGEVDVGREIQIDVSVVEVGDAEDWQMLFHGYVDGVEWSQTEMTLTCRDKSKTLLDTWIETPALYGNDSLTENVDTVIQEIIDDTVAGVTVTVVGTPSLAIVEYTQRRQSLADAVTALADLIGWDLRYKWNSGSSDFELTLEEPNRSKTTLDHTFTTSDYFAVTQISKDNADIRNAWEVQYDENNSVVVTDSGSIAEYERRYAYIDAVNDPQIASSAVATTFANAILGDTAQPLAYQAIEGRLFWPVELGDLYRWPANDIHYNSAQDMAVTAYTHRLSREGNTTTFYLRGQPSGGSYKWVRKSYASKRAADIEEVTGTIEPNTDTIVPTVEAQTSQASGVGTVTLVLNDPGGYVNAVSFESFNSGGDFDASSDPTGWSGYDNTAPFTLTDTVNLVEGHNSFIAWAVRYDLGAGNKWIRNVVTFDRDAIPNFTAGLHLDGTSVWLSQTGDEDFASLTYAKSKVSMPSDASADSGTVINGRTTDGTEIETAMADGETLYVKATGWSSTGGTGTQSNTYWRGQIGYTAPGAVPRPPAVQVKTDQNAGTGTIALTISDPDSVVNATAFEPITGGIDYDLSTDPSTWAVFDTSAPYTLTDTVTITEKHISRIGWAVRYDLGEGAGNEWVQGEVAFDSDVVPNVRSAIIGFDDNGIPLVSLIADEDSLGVVYVLDIDADPTAAAAGASTTLSGAEASGQTVLSVNSTTGFNAGNFVLIYDGTQGEVCHLTAAGVSDITVATGIANSYSSGANVVELENTGAGVGEYSGALNGQTGTVKQEAAASGPERTANVDIGSEVRLIATPFGVNGIGTSTNIFRRRRGDTQYIKPAVQVSATRSGSSVIVALDITDPTLAVSANPSYKRRDGDDQTWDGTWQTSWTRSTGTAGTAQTLARSITLADPYTALSWRVQYTDENGDAQELGDDIDLASVQQISKELVVRPTQWTPVNESETYDISDPTAVGGHALLPGTVSTTSTFYASPQFPDGSQLTNIQAGMVEIGSAAIVVNLYRGSTSLATLTSSTGASLSETVSYANLYTLKATLNDGGSAGNAKLGVTTIDYDIPSYVQSY